MYVNAFAFGIMCTLLVEMAIVILANLPKKQRKNKKALKPINPNYKEDFDNGEDWIK